MYDLTMTCMWVKCYIMMKIAWYLHLCADIYSYYFIIILMIGQEVLYIYSTNFGSSDIYMLNAIIIDGTDLFIILKM